MTHVEEIVVRFLGKPARVGQWLIGIATGMSCAACGVIAPSTSVAHPSHTVTGAVTLHSMMHMVPLSLFLSGTPAPDGSPCHWADQDNDLKLGSSVTVTDAAGKVVGLGQLSDGAFQTSHGFNCTFRFTISSVPDSAFYGVQVANRPLTRFTRAQIGAPVALSVDD